MSPEHKGHDELGLDAAALAELIRTFNETTERMRQAHARLERKLALLSQELEEKNRELRLKNRLALLGEMAASIAHEIRNPLGGIELYAGLLERDLRGSLSQHRLISRILTGVKRLNKIIDDLLTFAGELKLSLRRCHLPELVSGALEELSEELEGKDIDIRLGMPADLPQIEGDPGLLRRVFVNIILNAIEVIERKGHIEIRSRTQVKDGQKKFVVVEITDSGPGLSEEMLRRLFTPFHSSKSKGTGLGLAIARRIITAHGGQIRAANREDAGACFGISLPVATSEKAQVKDERICQKGEE